MVRAGDSRCRPAEPSAPRKRRKEVPLQALCPSGPPVGADSCEHSPIATETTRSRTSFRDEHLDSQKDWCTYIVLMTTANRSTVKQTDEFIAQIQARLDQALRRHL